MICGDCGEKLTKAFVDTASGLKEINICTNKSCSSKVKMK